LPRHGGRGEPLLGLDVFVLTFMVTTRAGTTSESTDENGRIQVEGPPEQASAYVGDPASIAGVLAGAAVKELEADLARITGEQARIRENLKAVPAGDDLARRYLRLLGHAEDRIATLGEQLDAARSAVKDAQKALSGYIRSLKIQ
jgi:hypothetical protein